MPGGKPGFDYWLPALKKFSTGPKINFEVWDQFVI
jgi:hypothetical protein